MNLLIVVAFMIASASVGGGHSAGPNSQNPELAWPTAFSGKVAAGGWTNHSFDATGVQIKLSLPSTWTVNSPATPGRFDAIDRTNGLRLEIAETKPAAFVLDNPVTAEQLAGSIRTMQAESPIGYVIERAGQVRVGDRLWLWHQSRIPAFDATNAGAYKDRLNEFPYGSSRNWSFASTPGSQLVRVYFTVMILKGASEADIATRTTEAGAIFAEIVRRMTFGTSADSR